MLRNGVRDPDEVSRRVRVGVGFRGEGARFLKISFYFDGRGGEAKCISLFR